MLKDDLQNELFIEIGSNNYSYALVNANQDEKYEVHHSDTLIFNDLEKDILQTSFNDTKISLDCKKFTFIPSEIFNSEDLSAYIPYLQATSNETIFTNHLPELGFTAIYALENILLDKVEKYFPQAQIYPQFMPFLLATKEIKNQKNQLFANFKSDRLEIALYKNDKFQFYNSFQFENGDEAIYFILLAVQQNALILADLEILLSGKIVIESDLFHKIKTYITNAAIIDQQNLGQFYQNSSQSDFSNYFSLLSLHLCA